MAGGISGYNVSFAADTGDISVTSGVHSSGAIIAQNDITINGGKITTTDRICAATGNIYINGGRVTIIPQEKIEIALGTAGPSTGGIYITGGNVTAVGTGGYCISAGSLSVTGGTLLARGGDSESGAIHTIGAISTGDLEVKGSADRDADVSTLTAAEAESYQAVVLGDTYTWNKMVVSDGGAVAKAVLIGTLPTAPATIAPAPAGPDITAPTADTTVQVPLGGKAELQVTAPEATGFQWQVLRGNKWLNLPGAYSASYTADPNPQTGANDAVALAAGLALAALCAAGGVLTRRKK